MLKTGLEPALILQVLLLVNRLSLMAVIWLFHLLLPPVILMDLQAKRMKRSSESKCLCLCVRKIPNITYTLYNSLQEIFEKRRRRRESHNAVERRRRDNINERIHGNDDI